MGLHRPVRAHEGLIPNRTANSVSMGFRGTLKSETQEVPRPEVLTFSLRKRDCMQIPKEVNVKIAFFTPSK